MEEQYEKESGSCAEVQLKKSSSKDGGFGWDIKVRCDSKATQEQMDKIADMATITALKVKTFLNSKGVN